MGRVRSEEELYRETVPALLAWYSYNARILPWREDPTPYHVWISEIMLQQTRVEAVRGYYERFLREFPTVASVAGASEDTTVEIDLTAYRVRNIAKAARELCERCDGALPADYALLCELPGIGDYTAGAIASIAFGIRVPAVDGNVLRVFSRLTGYRDDIRTEAFKKHVRECLQTALTEGEEQAGAFNQAVMDLGATVCIPNGKPHCDQCPLQHLCRAFAEDLTEEIPKKTERKARPVERKTILVIVDPDGRVLLHRRPAKGLLAGMWEFPNVPGHLGAAAAKKAAEGILAEAFGSDGNVGGLRSHRLADSRHIFSHVEWEMRGYRVEASSVGENRKIANPEYVRVTPREIAEEYGLPQAFGTYRLQV